MGIDVNSQLPYGGPVTVLDGHALSVRALTDAVITSFSAGFPVQISAETWKQPTLSAVVEAVIAATGCSGTWSFSDPHAAPALTDDALERIVLADWARDPSPSVVDTSGEAAEVPSWDQASDVEPPRSAPDEDDAFAHADAGIVTYPEDAWHEQLHSTPPEDFERPWAFDQPAEPTQLGDDDGHATNDALVPVIEFESPADLLASSGADEVHSQVLEAVLEPDQAAVAAPQNLTQVVALNVAELSVGELNVREMHVTTSDTGRSAPTVRVEEVLPPVGQAARDTAAIPADPLASASYAFFALQQPVMIRNLHRRPEHTSVQRLTSSSGATAHDLLRDLAQLDSLDAVSL